MKILGLDFETQGLDTETTNITEVGAVLCGISQDTSFPQGDTFRNVEKLSSLCYSASYPPQSEEAVELTGITDTMLHAEGLHPEVVVGQLLKLAEKADYLMAYNARFDRAVLQAACARYKLEMPKTPWLCAMVDVPYPEKMTCAKLSHRAYDHGVMVDPRTLHRATQDVELMLSVISHYKLSDIITYAHEPWVYFEAVIMAPWKDNGIGKAKAASRGFTWQTPRGDDKQFPGKWVKRVKESKLTTELEKANKIGLLIQKL